MFKKISVIFLTLLLAAGFAGCGTYKPPVNQGGNPTEPGSQTTPPAENPPQTEVPPEIENPPQGNEDPPTETRFTVTLKYNDQIYRPQEPIIAYWTGGGKVFNARIISGVATLSNPEMDGDYRVTLSNPPTGYTYNSNIYTATNDKPAVEIELQKILPMTGLGTGLYSTYTLAALGTYRMTFENKNSAQRYFTYMPSQNGTYIIESFVDVTANEVTPTLEVYGGNSNYRFLLETVVGGGLSSSYTKNFKYQFQYASDEAQGNSIAFSIKVDTRTGKYPVNVDFVIRRESAYDREEAVYEVVIPQENVVDGKPVYASDVSGTWTYVHSTNGGVFDGSKYKLNPEDGYYHLYDPVTGEYGAVLYARLTQSTPLCEIPVAYLGYGDNLGTLMLYPQDYRTFMWGGTVEVNGENIEVTGYSVLCNRSGDYMVNEEIKQFLQDYAVSQRFFMDGNGWAETAGYNSSEEDQWLWACGYYVQR